MNFLPHDFFISSIDFVHRFMELFAEHIEDIIDSKGY
jgi:hypothetical protein